MGWEGRGEGREGRGVDRKRRHLYVAERYWFEVGNRRKFFEKFAAKHDFDPLISDNWYPITKQMIITKVIQDYKNEKKKRKEGED